MQYTVDHFHLLCSNLQNTIDFFTKTLGATLVAQKKFAGVDGATLDLNGTKINLRIAGKNESVNPDNSRPIYGYHHMCVRVDSTDAAYKELSEQGFVFAAPPVDTGQARVAFFKGPDNIVIEVFQPL